MDGGSEDKTEDPTPKKLEDARNRGDVPQSREFGSFIVFLGLALALYFTGERFAVDITRMMRSILSLERGLPEDTQAFVLFLKEGIWDVLSLTGPLLLTVLVFGVIASVSQFGLLLTWSKLQPDFNKINPIGGIQRIFSKETLVEFVKSNLKLVVFSLILYLLLNGEVEKMIEIGAAPVPLILEYTIEMVMRLLLACLLFVGVLGLLDFSFQKWSYWTRMKMTIKEVRDEYKQREGDPHVKARIRQVQRETARARMMDKVPQADVVVANPTHVAVAIQYKRGEMSAPVVVAKGAGHIAVRIKTLAVESGVPVLEKRELARFLFKNVEIGERIPESLYSAVAEVLAFVFRLKKKFKALGGIPKRLLDQTGVV